LRGGKPERICKGRAVIGAKETGRREKKSKGGE